jgi:uncharacterized protein YbaA (DUF1428 family)
MPKYIDGFVLPIAQDKVEEYRAIASQAAAIWREHGALEYRECVGESLEVQMGTTSFPAIAGTKPGETVIFAYAAFESRAHRDEVNAKIFADPRMNEMCQQAAMPFDPSRMAYGGFQTIVEA